MSSPQCTPCPQRTSVRSSRRIRSCRRRCSMFAQRMDCTRHRPRLPSPRCIRYPRHTWPSSAAYTRSVRRDPQNYRLHSCRTWRHPMMSEQPDQIYPRHRRCPCSLTRRWLLSTDLACNRCIHRPCTFPPRRWSCTLALRRQHLRGTSLSHTCCRCTQSCPCRWSTCPTHKAHRKCLPMPSPQRALAPPGNWGRRDWRNRWHRPHC